MRPEPSAPARCAPVQLSVIVPVCGRHDDPRRVYGEYRRALQSTGLAVEFIYVLDFPVPRLAAELRALQSSGEPVSVFELAQPFGEAVCIGVGFEHARGDRLLVLPPFFQVEPAALPALVHALERVDLAAGLRDRRQDHVLNRARAWGLAQIARIAGPAIRDLGCIALACRRAVLQEIVLQDEHHRFLPLLAQNAGFTVEHVVMPQAASDRCFRPHRPSMYLDRLLDLLAIAFLLRFMQRPFRFFGTVGGLMTLAGVVLGLVLSFERVVLEVPLADRPALLLATLLVVLGVQVAAVGLIAEIIIFVRARRLTTYHVDEVVEQAAGAAAGERLPANDLAAAGDPAPTPSTLKHAG